MRFSVVLLAAPALLASSQTVQANEAACFDLKVRAKPVAQIPTEFPTHEEYIVLSWPWFVDLRIKRVLEGELEDKELTALAVLHSTYVRKTRTFLLRRNDLGGFNILRPEDPDALGKCTEGVGPASAYLRPADGLTLNDYRRASEEEWKRYWDDDES